MAQESDTIRYHEVYGVERNRKLIVMTRSLAEIRGRQTTLTCRVSSCWSSDGSAPRSSTMSWLRHRDIAISHNEMKKE